jgi:hypothetical protein
VKELVVLDSGTFRRSLQTIHSGQAVACLGIEFQDAQLLLIKTGHKNIELIDLSQYSEKAAQSTREYVIENITKLPGIAAVNPIVDTKFNIDLWPLLAISEKSPMRGKIHQRLFRVSLISQLLENQKFKTVEYELSDKFVSAALLNRRLATNNFSRHEASFWIHAVRYATTAFGIKSIRALLGHKHEDPTPTKLIFSLFPYWWLNPYTSSAKDRFFPAISDTSKNQNIGHVSWLTTSLFGYIRNRKLLMGEGGIARTEVLQDSLKFTDFASLFSVRRFKSLIGYRELIRSSGLPKFHNLRVNDIVAFEMSSSVGSGDLQLSILNYISLNRFLKENLTTHLVFRFESQPIDRAVIFASAGLTKSVGYWHSSMSMCENYTSLHFPEGFLENLNEDELVKAGFPSRMLLPNLYCAETLAFTGYDPKYTGLCGPTRHLDEMKVAKALLETGKLKSSNKVAVAFSSDPASAKFMESVIIELHKMYPQIFFLVKTHPAFRTPPEFFKNLESSIGKEAFRIIGNAESLLETLCECSAIVVSGTQLAFESMLVDVVPVVYEPKSSYIATNFKKFEDYCFITSTVAEIGDSIDSIFSKSDLAEAKRRNWRILIEKQFGQEQDFSWDSFIDSLEKL